MEYSYSSYHLLSTEPGVYIFRNKKRQILYVGKAKSLKKRVSSYFQQKDHDPKTKILVSQIETIETIQVRNELESLLLEANLIKKYKPKYNLRLTDGKSYVLARITVKDKYPSVLVARKQDDKNSIYFGPFPSGGDLRVVMKIIRKIFPYQSTLNHPKRKCLYNHLGLCPCPPLFQTEDEFKNYKKNIKHIKQFFEGKSDKILRELEKERDELSKSENFEEASKVQKKIYSIKQITSQNHNPFEYVSNPKLKHELREKEISELIDVLKSHNVIINDLERIECYDISNISGTHATGSMVVFVEGEKSSKDYRRFKIKRPPRVIPNDFAMMQEVIRRRLTHKEWETPSLIIVDGGKGQVSSAKKVLDEKNLDIPLIGIAKKEEILVTTDFQMIRLPKTSNAINLVKRIRDEAHRFAITYHKKLRSKYLISS